MSKTTVTTVAPSAVREAFRSGRLNVSDVLDAKGKPVNPASILGAGGDVSKCRGRVNPAFVAHFEANTPNTIVREKFTAPRMVTVPMFSKKTGRPVKSIEKPVDEVRKAAGTTGKAGRLSQADLLAAAKAFGSGEPKAAPVKAAKPVAKKTTKPAAKASKPAAAKAGKPTAKAPAKSGE